MSDAIDLTDILAAVSQQGIWMKECLKIVMSLRTRLDAIETAVSHLENNNDALLTHALAIPSSALRDQGDYSKHTEVAVIGSILDALDLNKQEEAHE